MQDEARESLEKLFHGESQRIVWWLWELPVGCCGHRQGVPTAQRLFAL